MLEMEYDWLVSKKFYRDSFINNWFINISLGLVPLLCKKWVFVRNELFCKVNKVIDCLSCASIK